MATCAISGNLIDPTGTAVSSATVFARVNQPVVSSTSVVAPVLVSAISDASGNFVLTLQQSISVIFTVQYPVTGTEPMLQFSYTGNIPASATADFVNVIVDEV